MAVGWGACHGIPEPNKTSPTPPQLHVVEIGADDYYWPFRTSECAFAGEGFSATLDPFPAYRHDAAVVTETLEWCAEAWPFAHDVTIWVADREEVSRTNGFTARKDVYERGEDGVHRRTGWSGQIFLSGKRIPIHPAISRYVTAHELGHVVYGELQPDNPDSDNLAEEYAAMRGVANVHGHGGVWHRAVEEVFACDFRIVVAGIEAEYWPHSGVPHPDQDPAVIEWWRTNTPVSSP